MAANARERYVYESAPPAVHVRFAGRPPSTMAILVHTAGEPQLLAEQLWGAVAAIDPDQPVFGLRDMELVVASQYDLNRLSLALLALFGAVALVLAITGIYGWWPTSRGSARARWASVSHWERSRVMCCG